MNKTKWTLKCLKTSPMSKVRDSRRPSNRVVRLTLFTVAVGLISAIILASCFSVLFAPIATARATHKSYTTNGRYNFFTSPTSLGFLKSRPSPVNQQYVSAANGKAFTVQETVQGLQIMPLRTELPVFKAFGLSANGKQILYTSLKDGVPTGELYEEDFSTRTPRKISSHLVLEAAWSPTDENMVAYTFASGEAFGLALVEPKSGRTQILVAENVLVDNFQWDDSGRGIYYFETGAQDSHTQLTGGFVSVEATAAILPPSVPAGLPILNSPEPSQSNSQISADDGSFSSRGGNAFRALSTDGEHEVWGDNLLGDSTLYARAVGAKTTEPLGQGQLLKVMRGGIIMRQVTAKGSSLEYVNWKGESTAVATTVTAYNLPLLNSKLIQGGDGYSAPGNCSVGSHVNTMAYAYDLEGAIGAHALAAADGLVVFTTSTVTCNTIDTDCADYSPTGCPGTFLGNVVIIQHADGTYTKYAHMETGSLQVEVGTSVCQGLYVGRQGHTGTTNGTLNGCGDHLHFQRQSSPDIFGQSIAVDFSDVASNPLTCNSNYTSASTEVSHSITPSSTSFGIPGGNGTLDVTSTGCNWTATSNDTWITITSPGAGNGNQVVGYSVADNSTSGDRIGTITVAGHLFTVSQSGGGTTNQAPVVNAGSDQSVTLPGSVFLNGSVSDDGLPGPPGAFTAVWSKVSGPGAVNFGNPSGLSTTASFTIAGIYVLRLTANDGVLSSSDDLTVLANVSGGGGALSANRIAGFSSVNLTAEGTADWAHWGLNTASSFDHKSGVTSMISNYTQVGPINVLRRYTGGTTNFTWTDGTPTPASNTTTEVFEYGLGNGFELSVPADTTTRTLKLYVALFKAQGRLEATISDGSASPILDTSFSTSAGSKAVYVLDYRAATSGQSLTIRWTMEGNSDPAANLTLSAATLAVSGSAPTTGVLTGSLATSPASVNLTAEGTADWAHWGLTSTSSFNHRSGVTSQISNYTKIGTAGPLQQKASPTSYVWSNGTPTVANSGTPTGVFLIGVGNGFRLTLPADTTLRTLKLYLGLWDAQGKLEVSLSDNSAPAFLDTSLINQTATSNGVYTLNYQAASSGQTLTIRWTVNASFNTYGNVTLQAATLVSTPTSPPAFTSANATTFIIGNAGTFLVTTTGSPTPTISKSGTLPSGLTFIDNGNGAATLSGTPATGTAGSYPLTITASNGVLPDATQNFTLTVTSPGSLQFNAVNYDDPETNSGTHTKTVTVQRTGGSSGAVDVSYATSDGTATLTDNDYLASSGTLHWNDGDSADKTFTVTVKGDPTYETNETVNVTLSAPTGGATIGGTNPATLTITNDDNAPSFTIDDVTQQEGNSGTTLFVFTVTRTGSTALASSVNFTTQDGSATIADGDYQNNTGTLTFAPGDTDKPITVLVNGDTLVEPDEEFFVNLDSPTNATINDSQGQGTIQNDDASGAYTWVGPVGSTLWTNPSNWSPARIIPTTSDILIFDGGITSSPTVTGIPSETIKALHIQNGVSVTFNVAPLIGTQTLTISGAGGDLLVQGGGTTSSLTLAGDPALNLVVTSSATGSISGLMIFQDGAPRLIGTATSAITFENGSIFTTNANFTGNAFGDGSSAVNGAAGSVVFASGSSYFHHAGSSPFGNSANPAVAVFQTGSLATFLTTSGFEASNRTYADLAIGQTDPGGVAVNASDSGTGNFQFDNVTISAAGTTNSSLAFTGLGSSAVTIQGHITSNGEGTGTLPDVTLTAPGGITINKSGPAADFGNDGNNARSVNLDGNVTVTNGTTLTLSRIVQLGFINPQSKTLTVNLSGALNGGTTGYVIGSVAKLFDPGSGQSFTFHIGEVGKYTPAALSNLNVTGGGSITANTTGNDNVITNNSGSFIKVNKDANRSWNLSRGSGLTLSLYDATFTYAASDVDGGANEANFVLRKLASGIWTAPSGGSSVNTGTHTITGTGFTDLSDFALGEVDSADLQVTNFYSPDPVNAGENITYTVALTNAGPDTASSVTVSDLLSLDTTLVSVTTPAGWTRTDSVAPGSTGTLSFTKPSAANGETATFTVVARVNSNVAANIHILNKATASSSTSDPDSSNNTNITADTTTQTNADLEVTKTDSPDPVIAGNNITYTISFTNHGPSDAQNVTVTDAAPANTTFVSSAVTLGNGWSTSNPAVGGTGDVVFSKTSVIAGETASFTVVLKVNGSTSNGTTISNNAVAASTTTDPTAGNNTGTATTTALSPGTLSFIGAPYSTSETNADHNVTITVQRTGGSVGAISVHYATSGGTATAGSDYVETFGDLIWADGDSTDKTFNVAVKGDPTFEADETVNLTLSGATGGAAIGGTNPTTLTIVNDDAAPAFAIDDVTLSEGNSGTTSYVFTVSRSGSTALDSVITYSTVEGSAVSPSDFTSITNGSLTVLAGQTSGTITVLVNGDTTHEANEAFTVHLSNLTNGVATDADGLGTITNDDPLPSGILTGSLATSPASVNLTAEGTADWAHWGLTSTSSFNHRSGVTSQISNYTKIGTAGPSRQKASPTSYSWSNGTPTVANSGTPTGVYLIGVGNGFRLTLPADTNLRTLKIYLGLWDAQGKLEVSLSDNSAPAFIDTSLINQTATSNGVYTLNYQAASSGQTLTIRWTVNASFNTYGNVTLQAASCP